MSSRSRGPIARDLRPISAIRSPASSIPWRSPWGAMASRSGCPADSIYEVHDGQGLGFVRDPRGMEWGGPPDDPGLYVANAGNSSADKLNDVVSTTGIFRVEIADQQPLVAPTDAAVDLSGFLYV